MDAFLATGAEAGWHDIFALSKRGAMAIEGNLQPLMANLQYVKDLAAAGEQGMSAAPIEPIVGRYVSFDIAGRRCRVYFEEAGQGIPWSACIPRARTPGSIGT